MDQNWTRIIAHIDMDAFFASVEQRDFPALKGRPIAVTNGKKGTCIITRSYEARTYGIKTGMRLPEARKLCPGLIVRPSRPRIYAQVSSAMLKALEDFTPDIEVFSVDEAFLEFTHCKMLYDGLLRSASNDEKSAPVNDEEKVPTYDGRKTPTGGEKKMPVIASSHCERGNPFLKLAKQIKQLVFDVTGLNCSVGISGDKTTAKFASSKNKPNGIKVIPPWQAKEALANVPVNELCGIGSGTAKFLAQYGVYHCGDIEKIPINILAKRFGNLGRRIWLMCQGQDPVALKIQKREPKTLGHGKVVPPNTCDKNKILTFLSHMSEKVGARLRANKLEAQHFWIGIKTNDGWITTHARSSLPTQDGGLIYKMARSLVETKWKGEGIFQCQITAMEPQPENLQGDLFGNPCHPEHTNCHPELVSGSPQAGTKTPQEDLQTSSERQRFIVNKITDQINEKFGTDSIMCAKRLDTLETPDVISPSWKPGEN